MEIKILGTGCAKCITTQQIVEKVVADNGVDAQISKVEDIMDIMNYGVMRTPGLVVDEKVVVSGRVPSSTEIKDFLS
jgi:small redox-active disulfide protein 2